MHLFSVYNNISLSLSVSFCTVYDDVQLLMRRLYIYISNVQVVGGERSGYIQVTVRGSTGPVCGSVDRATASYACRQKGFTDVISMGTVNSLG